MFISQITGDFRWSKVHCCWCHWWFQIKWQGMTQSTSTLSSVTSDFRLSMKWPVVSEAAVETLTINWSWKERRMRTPVVAFVGMSTGTTTGLQGGPLVEELLGTNLGDSNEKWVGEFQGLTQAGHLGFSQDVSWWVKMQQQVGSEAGELLAECVGLLGTQLGMRAGMMSGLRLESMVGSNPGQQLGMHQEFWQGSQMVPMQWNWQDVAAKCPTVICIGWKVDWNVSRCNSWNVSRSLVKCLALGFQMQLVGCWPPLIGGDFRRSEVHHCWCHWWFRTKWQWMMQSTLTLCSAAGDFRLWTLSSTASDFRLSMKWLADSDCGSSGEFHNQPFESGKDNHNQPEWECSWGCLLAETLEEILEENLENLQAHCLEIGQQLGESMGKPAVASGATTAGLSAGVQTGRTTGLQGGLLDGELEGMQLGLHPVQMLGNPEGLPRMESISGENCWGIARRFNGRICWNTAGAIGRRFGRSSARFIPGNNCWEIVRMHRGRFGGQIRRRMGKWSCRQIYWDICRLETWQIAGRSCGSMKRGILRINCGVICLGTRKRNQRWINRQFERETTGRTLRIQSGAICWSFCRWNPGDFWWRLHRWEIGRKSRNKHGGISWISSSALSWNARRHGVKWVWKQEILQVNLVGLLGTWLGTEAGLRLGMSAGTSLGTWGTLHFDVKTWGFGWKQLGEFKGECPGEIDGTNAGWTFGNPAGESLGGTWDRTSVGQWLGELPGDPRGEQPGELWGSNAGTFLGLLPVDHHAMSVNCGKQVGAEAGESVGKLVGLLGARLGVRVGLKLGMTEVTSLGSWWIDLSKMETWCVGWRMAGRIQRWMCRWIQWNAMSLGFGLPLSLCHWIRMTWRQPMDLGRHWELVKENLQGSEWCDE